MKDIINYNDKGRYHGYQERYHDNGVLYRKGFYNNDIEVDYEEYYYYWGKFELIFYI